MYYSGKKKPLGQVFREGNSSNKFVCDITQNEEKRLNKSFDTAQNVMARKPNLRQTQICLRRSLKRPPETLKPSSSHTEQLETKTELFIMPMPKAKSMQEERNTRFGGENVKKPSKVLDESISIKSSDGPVLTNSDPLDKPQRRMKVIVGNVGFVVQMAKKYSELDILWDIYGKLIKISKGKHRCEYYLLVRNINCSGPILQCSYFDFNKKLEIIIGSNVRLVGNIMGLNCLRTFKIEVYQSSTIEDQSKFMRIQNVNTFVLLQGKASNNIGN